MNIGQIESNLQKLIQSFSKETFIYDLLFSYGLPKASIARLKNGNLNLSKNDGEILWKKKLYFRVIQDADLHETIDNLRNDSKLLKHDPRFIIVTDNETLLAVDIKTQDTLDIEIKDLPKHCDFFLPWAGMEKAQYQSENPADVKAAERMAKLFDEIKKDNPNESPEFVHGLNVFLSRLLFCFFAEDTNIFGKTQFTNAISSHTQADGSDLNTYLDKLFEVLNTEKNKRKKLPAYLEAFPYVNGGLFRDKYKSPVFTKRSRKAIIDSGELDWSAINPDIFGSMIQAVITPEHRGGLGMHYTSVPNIMKVIEPLFLNELYEELEKARGNNKKLDELLGRIQRIKIFDPACGSGNFLIIAYKELRRLEMKILKARNEFISSGILLGQFYGIELDDFAHEVATLSLWLAEHQMNIEFFKEFGKTTPTLPLKDAGHIIHGNALRLNWEEVCPKNEGDEIFILGNPPYLGARFQSREQKFDVNLVFDSIKGCNSLDYISCWFYKGAKYIRGVKGQCAFVSTNSISQGEQVALLWPNVFRLDTEISFAHQAFKWKNNARGQAGVTVVIIGLKKVGETKNKLLFTENHAKVVFNISPYLTENDNLFIHKRTTPLQQVPELVYGNQAIDGGYLILSDEEKKTILSNYPEADVFFRRLYGADDFISDNVRWCIWIHDDKVEKALKIPPFKERFEKVRLYRENAGEVARSLVDIPYRFRYVHEAKNDLLIVPRTTSEHREYLPVGIKPGNVIVNDSIQVIYDPETYILAILSSHIHMVWIKAVAGGVETRIGYSNSLCYNSFPFPFLSHRQKDLLSEKVMQILSSREKHTEKTIAQLYDSDNMPKDLREAHHQLDIAVEHCYRSKPFESDEERLEYLFKLYEQMIADEKAKDTLFAEQKKTRRKRK